MQRARDAEIKEESIMMNDEDVAGGRSAVRGGMGYLLLR